IRIEHNSAGDRFLLRRVPHHEAVADEGKNRRFETKLGHKRITHGERLPILKKQSRGKISATVVHTHDSTVLKRWRLRGQARGARYHHVYNRIRLAEFRKRNDVAAPHTWSRSEERRVGKECREGAGTNEER